MSNTIGGIARTVGLWVLIICDVLLLTALFIWGNPWWGWFFTYVTIGVITWEITGKVVKKKTISTMYKEWIISLGKEAWKGYLCLALFLSAMIGLVVHLAFW